LTEALWKFDQATKNLHPSDPNWTHAEVVTRATLAQILMCEGLVLSAVDIEKRITAASIAAAEATAEQNKRLANWTRTQAWATAALTLFTIAQVLMSSITVRSWLKSLLTGLFQ
jgi:hypothetical protein